MRGADFWTHIQEKLWRCESCKRLMKEAISGERAQISAGNSWTKSQCVTSCCTETPHTGFQSNQLTSNQCVSVTSGFSSWLSKPADDQLKEHLASCSFKAGCLKSVSVQSMTTQTLPRKLTNDQPTATLQTREAISQESIFQEAWTATASHILFLFGFSPYQTFSQLTNIVSISDPAWPIWWSQSKAPQPVHRQQHFFSAFSYSCDWTKNQESAYKCPQHLCPLTDHQKALKKFGQCCPHPSSAQSILRRRPNGSQDGRWTTIERAH